MRRFIVLAIRYEPKKGYRVKDILKKTYCSKKYFKTYEEAEKQKYAIEQAYKEMLLKHDRRKK